MEKIYDLIIIGAGPAGGAAAIYASRARLDTLWLSDSMLQGGQIVNSGTVDNYPGLPGINGMNLGMAFANHAKELGMAPVVESVSGIEKKEDLFHVTTAKNEYMAKTVLYSAGAAHRKMGVPGEQEMAGAGVSYCATCDGAFFRNRTVAVVGGGNTACEDALFLANLASKVYLVHRRDELRADSVLQELILSNEKIEPVWNSVPQQVQGEGMVSGLALKNVKDGTDRMLDLDGVFVAVGMVPNSNLAAGIADTDDTGYLIAGEDCATSCPGFYAAGDVRTKEVRQVVTAASDGACAVHSIIKYLQENFR